MGIGLKVTARSKSKPWYWSKNRLYIGLKVNGYWTKNRLYIGLKVNVYNAHITH
jgi:hypothetical protein